MLSVENLTVRDSRGVDMVKDVSFDVRAGEIVGIAGVAGNGQSELLQAISGIRRADVTGIRCCRANRSMSPAPPIRPSCAIAAWPMCPRTASTWGW
jgi:ABC-type uncharacterized transport system ATPase subunit